MSTERERSNPHAISPNWANQTIWTGDNLDIMRGMNSASVDLIYADPPFNSNANYAAPIGSKAAGAAFKDTWGLDDVNLAWHGEIKHEHPGLYTLLLATRQIHGDSMMSYLIYMAVRIMEMKRILRPTGSIYLHCDPTASHYLKLLMDDVFGSRHFRNEIVWTYKTGGVSKRWFGRKHDVLLFYSRSGRHTFNLLKEKSYLSHKYGFKNISLHEDSTGIYRNVSMRDVWDIPALRGNQAESVGYPTQKPSRLLGRIILASSNPGEVVLDPFCGCATACIAAERNGRNWAGIDISPKAADLIRLRMKRELGLFYQGFHRTDVPKRTDLGKVIPYKDARNKKYLYGEQGGFCNGCSEHFLMRNLTVDHIVPRSKGGTDHISNLQLLCGNCNSIKGPRPHEYLMASLIDKGWIKRSKQNGGQPPGYQFPVGQPFQVHLADHGGHLVHSVHPADVVSP